jgi:hypothetical protein
MNELTRIGVDVAKQVFQVHGVDRHEQPVWRRRLSRDRWLRAVVEAAPPGCEVGMEACGGAHHWARQLHALGYRVKLIAPAVREAVREEQQERRQRCRGDLRGDELAQHALRVGEVGGAAGHPGRASHSGRPDRAAHGQGEPDSRSGRRVRLGRSEGVVIPASCDPMLAGGIPADGKPVGPASANA